MRGLILYFALAALTGVRSGAAVCSEAPPGAPRHEFELTTGYSPASPTLIGSTPDRKFVMAGLTYAYRCWDQKIVSISYAAGILPAAIVVQPEQFVTGVPSMLQSLSAEQRAVTRLLDPISVKFVLAPKHSVYGFGVTPVGFVFEFGARRRVYPLAETAGGIVASTEPIPIRADNASGLNFLFYFGGGLRIRVRERSALTLGYRFLHISNAGTTNFNPGLDNNVFYLGYSFKR